MMFKIDLLDLTKKEKTLINLYNSINNLQLYIQNKNSKEFIQSKKCLEKSMKIFSNVYFNKFGTEWEKKANSFFEEMEFYVNDQILSKLKMRASDSELINLKNSLERMFSAFYDDAYEALYKELKEANDTHRKHKKTFLEKYRIILEKYKLDVDSIVGIFMTITLIIITFFTYWGLSKLFKFDFSITQGIIISLMVTATIYYGIKIVKEFKIK